MVSAVVMLVMLMLYIIFRNQIIPQTRHALEDKAITIARTLALMPLVSEGLVEGRSKEIQAYTSKITRRNDIMFVVVIDMNSIRYSHPDASMIGKHFVGGGQKMALRGEESISEGEGLLGKSLRAFVPVYNNRGSQVGVVVVGSRWNVCTVWYGRMNGPSSQFCCPVPCLEPEGRSCWPGKLNR